MEKLRLGILGVSNHFIKRMVLPIGQLSEVDMVAIASRDINKSESAAKEFGIRRSYGSYEALLKDPNVDAVYIPLPNHLHAEWIEKSLNAGKHVLCEKPLCMNTEEARRLVQLADDKGKYLMEAFMYKYHPQWQFVYDHIRTNNIGKINYIHTSFSYNNQSETNIRNIVEYGGGGMRDIGCYAISVPRFILQREPLKISCQMSYHPKFKTDVMSTAILDFDSAKATFQISTNSDAFQKVDIVGTAGSITVNLPFNAFADVPAVVTVNTAIGKREIKFDIVDQYGLMVKDFARAILRNAELAFSSKDAVLNQKVLDAAISSTKSGLWQNIDDN
ncbi:Gfo/Idh/MocA family protein [Carboxylicivirga sp. N1Y90]|uniref:Gfo/Idh/MocA family protein n=1 Tax=Carboxylicivirga fragile TaxID=3417571 RepID=UPI003D327EE7|nr:Gfo/Idh/MocA family oxidoreductase [Marinilabiliaceae bacterium N1Y90]